MYKIVRFLSRTALSASDRRAETEAPCMYFAQGHAQQCNGHFLSSRRVRGFATTTTPTCWRYALIGSAVPKITQGVINACQRSLFGRRLKYTLPKINVCLANRTAYNTMEACLPAKMPKMRSRLPSHSVQGWYERRKCPYCLCCE